MVVDQGLSDISNAFIYSAMLVYTFSFLGFAIDLAGRGRALATPATVAATPVRVGGGDDGPPPPAGSDQPGQPDQPSQPGQPGQPSQPGQPGQPEIPARSRALGIAMAMAYLAFVLHLAGVVARGLSVERVPWGNMYEFSISGTLVVTAVFLAVVVRRPDLRFLGTFVIGPVLLSLGLATVVFYTEAAQLLPALKSFWLIIHVSVAFIASALFTLGFSLTVIQLVQERRERFRAQGQTLSRGRFMDALPGSTALESSAYQLHAIAFPLWSFTLIAGAIWAEKAWSSYWSWDPKEVWSFVIWVVYAAYLHARATQGYQGRRAAYLALAGFACLMFNYLGVNFLFVGFHGYASVG
jgi:cytochrome c-type biogenesis protein CcsB